MKQLRVLSIDFDYFQKVSEETLKNCYPDGCDLPSIITEVTWSSHYANNYKELMEIIVDDSKLKQLINIILNQNRNTPIMIAQSHKYLYQFIQDNMINYNGCKIWNIDMHHDCFNRDANTLDCGNWGNFVLNNIPNSEIVWVARPISELIYGKIDYIQTVYDFKSIRSRKFDIIFLCRSDTWLPPHLDKEFDKLYKLFCSIFYEVMVDKQITKPRDYKGVIANAKEQQKMIRQLMEKTRKNKK